MNTNNVTNIKAIFSEMLSLESMPDLLKLNIDKTDTSCMFNKCTSLKVLPNISGWNTSIVAFMKGMFSQ